MSSFVRRAWWVWKDGDDRKKDVVELFMQVLVSPQKYRRCDFRKSTMLKKRHVKAVPKLLLLFMLTPSARSSICSHTEPAGEFEERYQYDVVTKIVQKAKLARNVKSRTVW